MTVSSVRRPIGSLLVFSLVLISCGLGQSEPPDLLVVVTTTILGDVVDNIVEDDAVVEVLMPIGADPHSFQLSSQQVARINEADLVVSNGLLLEEAIINVLEAAESDGVNLLEVGSHVDPIAFREHGHDEGEEAESDSATCDPPAGHSDEEATDPDVGHDHEEGACDPHFWMDPLRMAEAARLIGAELAALDPTIDWLGRAEGYATDLTHTDAEIVGMLADVAPENRVLITNHESLGYFAERYAFEVIGVVIPSGGTAGAPSSQDLAELVSLIDEEGVPAIFAENIESTALADAVAAEAGRPVEVVELYTGSLGEPGSGADTYQGMLLVNAERIADALG